MVQSGLFLATLLIACFSGSLAAEPCSLTDEQKFSPSCENIVSLISDTIYPGEDVALNFHPSIINGTLLNAPANATLFSSSADFCGVDSFSEGITCSINHLIVSEGSIIQGTCQDNNPEVELSYGPGVLVLGFGAPYSCNVLLNATLGQTVSLIVDVPDSQLAPYQFNSSGVLIVDSYIPDLTTNVHVRCSTPAGPAPMLSVRPLSQAVPPPTINTSTSATVEYLGGFTNQSSAVFTCTSSTGFKLRGYIVTKYVTPAVLFPSGDYVSVVVGSPLTIPAYIITSETIDQSSVEFRPVNGIPVTTPTITFSSDGVKIDIVYSEVLVPSTTAHEICFNTLATEGSGSGMIEPLTKTCLGLFTLTVTVPQFIVSEPVVYGLIGRSVNISCLPNNTQATVDWKILNTNAMYSSQLETDPQFVFTPPQLRHELTFDLTMMTLGSYGYDADLSSYSNVQLQCSFTNEGTHNTTIVLRQDVITVHRVGFSGPTINNNSIVNGLFSGGGIPDSQLMKRNVPGNPVFTVQCTTVQGDHDPIWSMGNSTVTSNTSYLTLTQSNQYVSTLAVIVNTQTAGRYTCRSAVSGATISFLLVADNPYVSLASPSMVTALLGSPFRMTYIAAYNSAGFNNFINRLVVVFTSASTESVNYNYGIANEVEGNQYQFMYTLASVGPWHRGVYTVRTQMCEVPFDPACLSQQTVTLNVNVPQLIPSTATVDIIEAETLRLSCFPSEGSFAIRWAHNGIVIPSSVPSKRNVLNSVLSPPGLYTNLTLSSIVPQDAGTYACSIVVDGMVAVSKSIAVTVQALRYTCFSGYSAQSQQCIGSILGDVVNVSQCCSDMSGVAVMTIPDYDQDDYINEKSCTPCNCQTEFNGGVLWAETAEGGIISALCSSLSSSFASGASVYRRCGAGGQWTALDLTNCTARPGASSFALLWMSVSNLVGMNESQVLSSIQNVFSDQQQLTSFNVERMIEMMGVEQNEEELMSSVTHLSLRIDTVQWSNEAANELFTAVNSLLETQPFAFPARIIPGSQGLRIFNLSESCPCRYTAPSVSSAIISLCPGSTITPCDCSNGDACQCQDPYVGDGTLCTPDSDGDGYPNTALSCNGTEPYCSTDVCPDIYNPQQDISACTTTPNMMGCPLEVDSIWSILWANTPPDAVDTQRCPGGAETIGNATRYCTANSEWEEPSVINCVPRQFQSISDRANEIFRSDNLTAGEQLNQSTTVVMELAVATNVTTSLLPVALEVANEVVRDVVTALNTLQQPVETEIVQSVVTIISNCLQEGQLPGWVALQNDDGDRTRTGSGVLLDSSESFAAYIANILAAANTSFSLMTAPNIIIAAATVTGSQDSLKFPPPGVLEESGFSSAAAAVSLPSEELNRLSAGENVSTAGILFRNLEEFLSALDPATRNMSMRPGSLLWSGQVIRGGDTSRFQFSGNNRVNLTFEIDMIPNVSNHTCVYWDNGAWSSEGVETLRNVTDNNGRMMVECSSSHLTAFAVLVDVSGSIQNFDPGHLRALQVVSYIGMAISMVCLLATIIFFAIQGKKLFQSVHMLIHLNLAISLFLAYLVFAAGAEAGTSSRAACATVAAFLHYLFLASFCWMLCEGVMLYLMLVVVFSRLSKKWWFFLLLGWAPPLVPVVIGLAAAHDQYGVTNEEGTLLFCWLSVQRGVIWAFVAPMLAVILINVVFLGLALRVLYKNRKEKISSSEEQNSRRKLAKTLLLACVILLPLLGLTWLFGLLTVNEESAVFAWLFTILNSAQGVAIFVFHVVRNDRVWGKLLPRLKRIKSRATQKYTLRSSDFSASKSTMKSKTYKDSYNSHDLESHDSTHVIANTYVEMTPFERKAEEARVLQEEEAARRMEEDSQLEKKEEDQQDDVEVAAMEKEQPADGSPQQEKEKLITEHESVEEEKEQLDDTAETKPPEDYQ